MAVTFALSQSWGSLPSRNDFLKIRVSIWEPTQRNSLSGCGLGSDLDQWLCMYTLTSFSNMRIPFSSILMYGIDGRLYDTSGAGSSGLSCVNTVYWRERISALYYASSQSSPVSFIVEGCQYYPAFAILCRAMPSWSADVSHS